MSTEASQDVDNGDDEEATIDVDEETAVSIFVLQINELAQGLDQATRDEIFSKGRAITDKVVEILANNAIRQDALNRENEEWFKIFQQQNKRIAELGGAPF